MFIRFLTTFVLAAVLQFAAAQPPTPAPPQTGPVLILGATAHLGNGQVLPNSAIAFDKGKLTLVADAATIRIDRGQFARIYDATGNHVYPGFIVLDSRLGLVEIPAVRATVDASEVGSLNPNARSIIAYNTDSDVIPTVRSNGILMGQIVPTSGTLSGSSSVVQFDAWNWEDAAVRTDDGIHLNWPSDQPRRRFRRAPQAEAPDSGNQYDKAVEDIQRYFEEAKAYCRKETPEVKNPRFESMRGLFNGTQNLYIHTDGAKTMQHAVLFAEKMGVRPVLMGASEAWMITGFLKEHQVPVVLNRTQSLPSRTDDDIDQPFKTPAALHAAGIPFVLTDGGRWSAQESNLPFLAGQAVGFGLPYEAAIQALTLSPAAILGIGGTAGSLEVGKDATLFISEGDALDMRTNAVTAAFIQGRTINLDTKQKVLQRRFEEKYERQ
ncbi:MAG: hypothetical protein EP344_08555 [Bacteroidetes bacterium]|nr:MAG: hypothetical protein EP344_08555 [Bacteroidota bacterium]